MKAKKIERVVKVVIELSVEEAIWLKNLVQNYPSEDYESADHDFFRHQLYDELASLGVRG